MPRKPLPSAEDVASRDFRVEAGVLNEGALEECASCLMRRNSGGVAFVARIWSEEGCLEKMKAVARLLLDS